jgi:hypothetical protein
LSLRADHESQIELLEVRVTPDNRPPNDTLIQNEGMGNEIIEMVETEFMTAIAEEKERGLSDDWITKIKEGYKNDDWFGPIVTVLNSSQDQEYDRWSKIELQKAEIRARRFQLVERILVLNDGNRVAIPNINQLRQQLCAEHHDTPLGGYFGRDQIYLSLYRRYFWPRMARTIAAYMKGCDICHHVKPTNDKPFGKLEKLEIPEERWSRIGIDFITKLPTTNLGYDCIVLIIDHLTKRAHFLPLTEKSLPARTFAAKFTQFYVRLHGIPDMIISDQDPRFMGDFWQSIKHTLQVKHGMSSAYHPQTDG